MTHAPAEPQTLAEHLAQPDTHQVFNQPTALVDYQAYHSDLPLQHWLQTFGASWAESELTAYGARCGGDLQQAGVLANKYKPEFHSHDRFGQRIDEVQFHPGYHQLMDAAISANMHASPWTKPQAGAHVARAGLEYLHMQADAGSGCPLTMTFAAVPALKHAPDVARDWLPLITSTRYDGRNIPFFDKAGVTIGMAMTEKQGGSDVRANTTRAYPMGRDTGNGAAYQLVGHKWFCSAPMCDAFLVLAYTEQGLSCFLLPRWRPDGSKNQFFIQRLKDKLGNSSNASSEVEFRGAFAWLIGDAGRGVRTIIEMVSMTRFDCMVGSSALMRSAVAQALHHTSGRSVFGKPLQQQPLMQNVLADLALESEAALAMSMRVAQALDQPKDEAQALFTRLATAVGKYWICKRAPHLAYEAMECIGGVGYVEENPLPRIYREAPVNAIWEGSGNVQCLDVLRALQKEPKVLDAYLDEVQAGAGKLAEFDGFVERLKQQLGQRDQLEFRARTLVDQLALALQGSVLLQHGDTSTAEAFVRSRLHHNGGVNYGTLDSDIPCQQIMARAQPQLTLR